MASLAQQTLQSICLFKAFRNMGIAVPITESGPFRVLEHGRSMLRPFHLDIVPVPMNNITTPGRYLVVEINSEGEDCFHHAVALGVIDGMFFEADGDEQKIKSRADIQAMIACPRRRAFRIVSAAVSVFLFWTPPWFETVDLWVGS